MNLYRKWLGTPSYWIAPLSLWLALADATSSIAADPPKAQAQAATAAPAKPAIKDDKPAEPKRRLVLNRAMLQLGQPVANQGNEEQRVRAVEPRVRPQFQQLLYIELALLRRACKPDAGSFAAVAKAADAGLKEPLHTYIVKYYLGRQAASGGDDAADPRTTIQDLLLPLVKEKLGPENVKRYRQDCDARNDARKHSAVLNLVSKLDDRLILTTEQRAKLVESLSANYQNLWGPFVEMYGMNGQFFPSIPDKSVVPLLDDQQKTVWEQTEKLSRLYYPMRIFSVSVANEATELQEIAHIIDEGKTDKSKTGAQP